MRSEFLPVLAAAAALALAGCGGERFGFGTPTTGAPQAAQPAPPPVDLAGRWRLSAPGGSCAMNLVAAQGLEGAIRPEGGCPGNFFTSRKWTFENDGLVIRDHNSAPLATLRLAGAGRFDGQSASGQPVSLVR